MLYHLALFKRPDKLNTKENVIGITNMAVPLAFMRQFERKNFVLVEHANGTFHTKLILGSA